MSEMFKLKVSVGNANVELEGDGELVHTIFTELREQGLRQLSPQNDCVSAFDNNQNTTELPNEIEEIVNSPQKTMNANTFIKPNIKDVVIKDLPDSEAEWLLVYALYVSDEGANTFTADDLRQMYKDSNRMTQARSKNFSANFKKPLRFKLFL